MSTKQRTTRGELYVLGSGAVGTDLLELADRHGTGGATSVHVRAVANSRTMAYSETDLGPEDWHTRLAAGRTADLKEFITRAEQSRASGRRCIIADCTASHWVADNYTRMLRSGLDVVSANKVANASSLSYYRELREASRQGGSTFRYGANVGAALPVLECVRELIRAGDRLRKLVALPSGSLSFCLGKLDEGMAFSSAVSLAIERGFMEPDPGIDLSGIDVARKLVIILREAGFQLEIEDMELHAVILRDSGKYPSARDTMERLQGHDAYFAEKAAQARLSGKRLRYEARFDSGVFKASVVEAGPDHPLYDVREGENLFALYTDRYSPRPLILRGYGAGPTLTASRLLNDALACVHPCETRPGLGSARPDKALAYGGGMS